MFKMAGIKIEEIMFWILIFAAIAVIIWKLVGSPTGVGTMIGIGSFILTSEIFVWKKIFSTENNIINKLNNIDNRIK